MRSIQTRTTVSALLSVEYVALVSSSPSPTRSAIRPRRQWRLTAPSPGACNAQGGEKDFAVCKIGHLLADHTRILLLGYLTGP